MKQTAILVMVLAASAFAQTQPGTTPATPAPQNQPAAQPGTAQPGTAQPAAPAGKHPLQAKTQPEYEAYNAAHAQMNDCSGHRESGQRFQH